MEVYLPKGQKDIVAWNGYFLALVDLTQDKLIISGTPVGIGGENGLELSGQEGFKVAVILPSSNEYIVR